MWLLAKDLPLPAVSRKLAPRYIGPYTIIKVINPSALRLQLPSSLKVHPVFHVSQVKPVANCDLSPPAPAPLLPRTLESSDMVLEVNRILAVRRRGRGFHYLVDWVGYGPEDRTWVPRSYFADPALLGDFYQANPQAIRQSPGVSRREGGPVAGAPVTTPPDQIINQPQLQLIQNGYKSSPLVNVRIPRENLTESMLSITRTFLFHFVYSRVSVLTPSSSSRRSSRVPSSNPRPLRQYLPRSRSSTSELSCSPRLTSATAASTAPGSQPPRNNPSLVFNPPDFHSPLSVLSQVFLLLFSFLPLFSSLREASTY